MNDVLLMALLGLVGVAAWPRLRSHRVILSLLYRGGKLLLAGCVLATGIAVVYPWAIQDAHLFVIEHMPEVIRVINGVPLDGQLLVAAVTVLVLLAPVSAWRELLVTDRLLKAPAYKELKTAESTTEPAKSAEAARGRPVREELGTVLERARRSGRA